MGACISKQKAIKPNQVTDTGKDTETQNEQPNYAKHASSEQHDYKTGPHALGPHHALAIEAAKVQNQLRKDPKSFIPKLEAKLPHFKGKNYAPPGKITLVTNEGPAAIKEAIEFLKKQQPLPELQLSEGLQKAAQDHANDIGPKGLCSHSGSDGSSTANRVEKYGKWDGGIGENIDFGNDVAEEAILSLLVDDGVEGRGHRKNLFNPHFKYTGIGVQDHKDMKLCCVIVYSNDFTKA